MVYWLKKILNKFYIFSEKKSLKIFFEYSLITWTIFIFLLYFYHYNLLYDLITVSLLISFALIFLIFIFGPKTKISEDSLFKILKKITKKESINLNLKTLFFIFLILALFIANFLIFNLIVNYLLLILSLVIILFLLIIILKKINIIKYFGANILNQKQKLKKTIILLVSIFFISCILLFLFPGNKLTEYFSTNNFLFYEFNIIQKLTSISFFYALILLLTYALGRKILKLFKINFTSKLELFIFSLGIGFIPIMFGTFLITLLGLLYSWVMWIMFISLLIFSYNELKQIFKELALYKLNLSFKNKYYSFKSIVLICLFVLLTFNFVIITKPIPNSNDDLHTYYNVPKLLVNYHEYIIHNSSASNMGQNTEMIYAAIMSIADSRYIIHFQLFFFVLCLLGFYLFLKKIFNEKYAIFGLLTIYFIPWNLYYLSTAKVECFLSFYMLLMLYLFFLWYNNRNNNYLYLLGIFSGISMGIKYNASLLIIPIFIIIITILIREKKIINSLKPLIVSSLLAIIFFSPWAIKNQIYFNNIIYPFEYFTKNSTNQNFINSNKTYEKENSKELNYLRHSVQYDKFSLLSFIKTAWRQSIGNSARGSWVNFGFIPFLIFPFYFLFRRSKKENILITIIFLYFTIWYIIDGARPWYAFFGFFMLYALLPSLLLKYKKFAFLYLMISFIIFIIFSKIMLSNIYYLIGVIDKKEYISRAISYHETAQYINNLKLESDEKILLVEDMRMAFINRNDKLIFVDPYLTKSSYALSRGDKFYYESLKKSSISYIIQSKRKEKAFFSWLKNNNITMNEYLNNYNGKVPSIYNNIKTLNLFLNNYTTLLFDDGYYTLYKLN